MREDGYWSHFLTLERIGHESRACASNQRLNEQQGISIRSFPTLYVVTLCLQREKRQF